MMRGSGELDEGELDESGTVKTLEKVRVRSELVRCIATYCPDECDEND